MKHSRRPLLLGHRGARKAALENSLRAFDLALAHGCDGFEFDVRRSGDGEAVVLHDATLGGLGVAATGYAELRRHARRQGQGTGEDLLPPTLEEVLQRYADRAVLDIEIKDAGLEERVAALLRRYPPQREYVVTSFLPEVLIALRRRDAGLPLGFICERSYALVSGSRLPVEYLIPHADLVNQRLLDRLHAAGKRVWVWTVNDAREIVRFAKAGTNAIISDDTELLCRTLGPLR